MKIFKHLIVFILIILVSACEKNEVPLSDVPFIEDNNIYQVVVEGGITTQKGKQYIRLSKPGHWLDEIDKNYAISGAELFISSKTDTFFMVEDAEIKGDYHTINEISGEIGNVYTLHIKYNDNLYNAIDSLTECSDISQYIPASSIDNYDDFMFITIHEHTFGFNKPSIKLYNILNRDSVGNDYFRIMSNREYTLDLPYVTTYEHSESPPQGVLPNDYRNKAFGGFPEDFIEIVNISISDRYYSFLLSVFNETDWDGGFFSSNHGNVKTNLSKGATGFFHASDIQKAYIPLKDFKSIYEQ